MEQTLRLPFLRYSKEAETQKLPASKPLRAPLFIQDAVTPFGDGTLLLALWRFQEADGQDDAKS
ncbi:MULTISPECIES: hypothetical protein [unclassified Leisingera]|uniref:hypothetical protein n=1 Tax=unclassified Leisingera TaxID=2614906 RepID=UPI000309D899|nr:MULTISPECIES: hypothetical protein [unclassified Leisingera]KIC24760.1 hypothetical protein RA23_09455 [Leisingera sp. ANG-S3]KIC28460.1 hypothetical protein RA24_11105 [Leisingera sp. ANG-M6]KIC31589.1 hypothetical protein RA25_15865 [Leisingera sp. ANG-S5]KIC55384.1 hypothetical protein RA22_01155 [Leisingera sp. ANG-S]KID09116.1 hypothetical protein GC1_10540 [Leisingera sp. ANG1]